MAYTYTIGIDETAPNGSSVPGNQIDDQIREIKKAYNERLLDLFGIVISGDPWAATKVGLALQIAASQAKATYYNAGNSGVSKTLSWNDGNSQKCTLTGNVTFTFTNPVAGSWYSLELVQDATGGRSITFPSSVRWTNNSVAPTLDTTANRFTLITLYYTGSVYLVFLGGTGFNVS